MQLLVSHQHTSLKTTERPNISIFGIQDHPANENWTHLAISTLSDPAAHTPLQRNIDLLRTPAALYVEHHKLHHNIWATGNTMAFSLLILILLTS